MEDDKDITQSESENNQNFDVAPATVQEKERERDTRDDAFRFLKTAPRGRRRRG
jgi:hypothetical protein